jgi:nitrogen fixation NifU-like protein
MLMYNEKVMDHFMNPRNQGEIADADGVGEVGNPTCGDIMRIFITVKDNIITDVKFQTFGCGAAVASSSMATELIKERLLKKHGRYQIKQLLRHLKVCPRSRCTVQCGRRRNPQSN